MSETLKQVTRAAARQAIAGQQLGGAINIDLVADMVVQAMVGHLNDGPTRIEIGSILSSRTREGRVDLTVGDKPLQLSIEKAREVHQMLGGAIEAAITDQIVFAALTEAEVSPQVIGRFLLELREKRQGSAGVVYPS